MLGRAKSDLFSDLFAAQFKDTGMTLSYAPAFRTALATALIAFGAQAGFAQTAPDVPLSTGEPVTTTPGPGDSYVGATFEDWELVCVTAAEGEGEDPCQMYQLLRDAQGNATAEITLFPLPAGEEAVAGATVLTPLETLLTAQLVMQVDENTAKRFPFTFCTAIGCIARVGFTAEDVDAFRRGSVAKWQVVPVAAPDQVIDLSMSLKGFTAAFADLTARIP